MLHLKCRVEIIKLAFDNICFLVKKLSEIILYRSIQYYLKKELISEYASINLQLKFWKKIYLLLSCFEHRKWMVRPYRNKQVFKISRLF